MRKEIVIKKLQEKLPDNIVQFHIDKHLENNRYVIVVSIKGVIR